MREWGRRYGQAVTQAGGRYFPKRRPCHRVRARRSARRTLLHGDAFQFSLLKPAGGRGAWQALQAKSQKQEDLRLALSFGDGCPGSPATTL